MKNSVLKFTLFLFFLVTTLGCQKAANSEQESKLLIVQPKHFTTEDLNRIKQEVSQVSTSISYAISKSAPFNQFDISRNQNSNCGSYIAELYNSTCFTGYYSEFYIENNPTTGYVPVHTSLGNNLDEVVSSGFIDFGISADPNFFLNQHQITSNAGIILNALGNEQSEYADSLQQVSSLSDTDADYLMTQKVIEQENRILNNQLLSYEDKEYIITTLEIELQNKENYMNQYENIVENSSSRKRTFLGKLWRGLAFVAITVATAGKAAVFVAKAAYLIAGKSALWAAGGAALKTAYFAMGVAAAWIPTGAELINKEKWNYNPWGSGSFSDILKFGSGIIGVTTNPLFGWTIV